MVWLIVAVLSLIVLWQWCSRASMEDTIRELQDENWSLQESMRERDSSGSASLTPRKVRLG